MDEQDGDQSSDRHPDYVFHQPTASETLFYFMEEETVEVGEEKH